MLLMPQLVRLLAVSRSKPAIKKVAVLRHAEDVRDYLECLAWVSDVSRLSLRIASFALWWTLRDFRDRNFLYSAMTFSKDFRI